MKINVMLICRQDKNSLRRMISDEDIVVRGEAEHGPAALDKLDNLSPDVVIITLEPENSDALSLAERIILNKPRCFVILVAPELTTEVLYQATRVGAHNIIEFPTEPKGFSSYIKSVYSNETMRIKSLGERRNTSWMSKVVTVFGAKGGLGKTTIAVNLAVTLAMKKKKVALVDLDLLFGDVHIFLDIEPKDTIYELVTEEKNPDIDTIRSYMVVHSSGVHVLCAPKSPEYAELIPAARIQALLAVLRSYYDYVIIDTPPSFNDTSITAVESSSLVLFVTGLDISILKNSKLALFLLDSLQQKDKIKVLVNRVGKVNSLLVDDVQKIIGCPIWAKIPGDYVVAVTALNRGMPIVTCSPKTKLSRAFFDIAAVFLNGTFDFDILSPDKKGRKQKGRIWKKR